MASHLSSGRVNVSLLRDDARVLLLDCLDKCNGTKVIFWDEKLISPFGLIAEFVLLKEHNVTEMLKLQSPAVNVNAESVVFLTKPMLSTMDIIADFVTKMERTKTSKKEYHIIFVPRKTLLCEKKLSDREVLGNFTNIFEYPVELFTLDSDVLSMELDLAFKECYVDEDLTSMYHVARALMTIQAIYGMIPNIYGKGKLAKHVYDLMVRMRKDLSGNDPQISPQIETLVLFDRSVDLLSVMATQLTYEGLLDEIFGIKCNIVKMPAEKFSSQNEGAASKIANEQKSIPLNSSDELFTEMRDKNFNAVGPLLSKKAKLLSAKYDERHGAKTIRDIKKFVDKLPHMQAEKKSLAQHTTMAELIKEVTDSETFLNSLQIEQEFMNGFDTDKISAHIEECISKEEPLIKVLRLICLQSITNNGLKNKVLDFYKREIMQTYGYEHFFTLKNLEKCGLLRVQGSKTYTTIRKTMKLTVEDINEQDPSDIAYVHSVYAPLSIRLMQFLINPGWRAIPDILNILPGPTVEEVQDLPPGLRKRRGSGSSLRPNSDEKKVTLVFFLGGCTFAEISALRFLSEQNNALMEYIVATTKLICGRTFIESLQETLSVPS